MNTRLAFFFQTCFILSILSCQPNEQKADQASEILRHDRTNSSILKGATIPADRKLFISSGQVSDANFLDEADGSIERYGDTYTQSKGTLEKIKGILEAEGLRLDDIVYMGVFVAPDPMLEGHHDFGSWFQAYSEYFNNEMNPNKVARSTIGVAALARPYLLIEVEVIAVYPN